MSKFNIGDRVETNGAAPKDNTMQLMPHRFGTVVGHDLDGKNKVLMDGDSEPSFIADNELEAVAAKRFRVRITRTEVYYRDVEVAANNLEDALQKAQDNEQANAYADLFDMPDDVSTTFKGADNEDKEDKRVYVAPFASMTIAADVKWDSDEGDTDLPDHSQTLTLTADELKANEVVDVGEIDETGWYLDEGKLEEFVSDMLTDITGFCHGGFTYDYKINKGE